MKLWLGAHSSGGGAVAVSSPGAPRDFRGFYDLWFEEVATWIRALGGPEADRDDIVQEVFLVVRRRLEDFDGVNPAGWLYRITQRQVRDFRRRTWVKHRGQSGGLEVGGQPAVQAEGDPAPRR